MEDVAAVEQTATAAYEKYVPRIGKKPAPMVADFAKQIGADMVYVDCEKQQVQAFVIFYPHGDHIHLENLAVRPERQGLGIGRRLALFVEQAAMQNGYNTIELYTNAAMTENFSFYQRLGYDEVGRREEDGFHRVFYRKELSTA